MTGIRTRDLGVARRTAPLHLAFVHRTVMLTDRQTQLVRGVGRLLQLLLLLRDDDDDDGGGDGLTHSFPATTLLCEVFEAHPCSDSTRGACAGCFCA